MSIDVYGRNRGSVQSHPANRRRLVRAVVGVVSIVLIWLAFPAVRNYAFQRWNDARRTEAASALTATTDDHPRGVKGHLTNHPRFSDIDIAVAPDSPAAAVDEIIQFAAVDVTVADVDRPASGPWTQDSGRAGATADVAPTVRGVAPGRIAGTFAGAGNVGAGGAPLWAANAPQASRGVPFDETNARGGDARARALGRPFEKVNVEGSAAAKASVPQVSAAARGVDVDTAVAASAISAIVSPTIPDGSRGTETTAKNADRSIAESLTQAAAEVPEPSLLLLSGVGVAALLRRQRPRRN